MANVLHLRDLTDNEGSVVSIYDDSKSVGEELRTSLKIALLIHGTDGGGEDGCGGRFNYRRVSSQKQILHCTNCGLRWHIPNTAIVVGELRTRT